MESQVKERIVGAAVLVGLGVWLIPWILDGTSEVPAEPDVVEQLTLPAAEESRAPVRTEIVGLEPIAPVADAGSKRSADEAGSESRDPEQIVPAGDRAPAASDEAAGEPEAATGQALADSGKNENEPDVSTGGWSVQVGAFSEIANANQLVARVGTYGFDASVSEIQSAGQTLHRVRVGGFEHEAQAEAAASSLSAHGFRPRVIPPDDE